MNAIEIGLDYETYSDVNLPECGLDNYVASPNFQPLMVSVAEPGKPEETFDFILDPDGEQKFKDWLILQSNEDVPVKFVAHNAGFERMVTRWFTQRWGWADIDYMFV